MFLALKTLKVFSIIVVISIITAANALQCSNCFDPKACRSSPVATVECSEENVSLHHRLLGYQNPTLASASGATGDSSAGYKCFDVKLSYTSALTGSTVLIEQKGCTYAGTDLCSGWNTEIAQVTRCSVCDSGDECNKWRSCGLWGLTCSLISMVWLVSNNFWVYLFFHRFNFSIRVLLLFCNWNYWRTVSWKTIPRDFLRYSMKMCKLTTQVPPGELYLKATLHTN